MKDKRSLKNIGFGGAGLSSGGGGYGFGKIEGEIDLVHEAVDVGIEIFDTAPIYGFNQSEITLGIALKNLREKVKIVSKSGVTWHPNMRVDMSNDPKTTQKMLEQSLTNLNTDYIDIYMIHWPDPRTDIRYPLEVLAKAQIEGKIHSIGLCNTNSEDLSKALEMVKVEYIQSECNLFNNPLHELKNTISENNIRTMGWGTFDKGILTCSVTKNRNFSKEDARSWAPWWKKSNWKDKVDLVEKLQASTEYPMRDIALQYASSQVDLPLCGFKSRTHIENTKKAISYEIPDGIMEEMIHEFNTKI
jgi:aryl-alcohol dehydrogenase-like predicted oxidoreductase